MNPNKRLIRIGKIKKEKKLSWDKIPTPVAKPQVREVVINTCYGGFGLSHDAIVEYYKRKGITVYPFVDMSKFDLNHYFKPYTTGPGNDFLIHYASQPLREDGTYNEGSYLAVEQEIQRDDPDLVAVVKQMGKKASGRCAELIIVEIPADVEWGIEEYDGKEWISEGHRTWR